MFKTVFLIIAFFIWQANYPNININSFINDLNKLNDKNLNLNKQLSNSELFFVYYFDGGCSSCIGTMVKLDRLFQQYRNDSLTALLISYSNDSALVNFYSDKANVSSIVLHDLEKIIYKKNQDFFQAFGNAFIVDKSGEIIISGNPLDNELIRKKYEIYLMPFNNSH